MWEYRIVRKEIYKTIHWQLVSVYHAKKKSEVKFCYIFLSSRSLMELKEKAKGVLQAFDKPVLDYETGKEVE